MNPPHADPITFIKDFIDIWGPGLSALTIFANKEYIKYLIDIEYVEYIKSLIINNPLLSEYVEYAKSLMNNPLLLEYVEYAKPLINNPLLLKYIEFCKNNSFSLECVEWAKSLIENPWSLHHQQILLIEFEGLSELPLKNIEIKNDIEREIVLGYRYYPNLDLNPIKTMLDKNGINFISMYLVTCGAAIKYNITEDLIKLYAWLISEEVITVEQIPIKIPSTPLSLPLFLESKLEFIILIGIIPTIYIIGIIYNIIFIPILSFNIKTLLYYLFKLSPYYFYYYCYDYIEKNKILLNKKFIEFINILEYNILNIYEKSINYINYLFNYNWSDYLLNFIKITNYYDYKFIIINFIYSFKEFLGLQLFQLQYLFFNYILINIIKYFTLGIVYIVTYIIVPINTYIIYPIFMFIIKYFIPEKYYEEIGITVYIDKPYWIFMDTIDTFIKLKNEYITPYKSEILVALHIYKTIGINVLIFTLYFSFFFIILVFFEYQSLYSEKAETKKLCDNRVLRGSVYMFILCCILKYHGVQFFSIFIILIIFFLLCITNLYTKILELDYDIRVKAYLILMKDMEREQQRKEYIKQEIEKYKKIVEMRFVDSVLQHGLTFIPKKLQFPPVEPIQYLAMHEFRRYGTDLFDATMYWLVQKSKLLMIDFVNKSIETLLYCIDKINININKLIYNIYYKLAEKITKFIIYIIKYIIYVITYIIYFIYFVIFLLFIKSLFKIIKKIYDIIINIVIIQIQHLIIYLINYTINIFKLQILIINTYFNIYKKELIIINICKRYIVPIIEFLRDIFIKIFIIIILPVIYILKITNSLIYLHKFINNLYKYNINKFILQIFINICKYKFKYKLKKLFFLIYKYLIFCLVIYLNIRFFIFFEDGIVDSFRSLNKNGFLYFYLNFPIINSYLESFPLSEQIYIYKVYSGNNIFTYMHNPLINTLINENGELKLRKKILQDSFYSYSNRYYYSISNYRYKTKYIIPYELTPPYLTFENCEKLKFSLYKYNNYSDIIYNYINSYTPLNNNNFFNALPHFFYNIFNDIIKIIKNSFILLLTTLYRFIIYCYTLEPYPIFDSDAEVRYMFEDGFFHVAGNHAELKNIGTIEQLMKYSELKYKNPMKMLKPKHFYIMALDDQDWRISLKKEYEFKLTFNLKEKNFIAILDNFKKELLIKKNINT